MLCGHTCIKFSFLCFNRRHSWLPFGPMNREEHESKFSIVLWEHHRDHNSIWSDETELSAYIAALRRRNSLPCSLLRKTIICFHYSTQLPALECDAEMSIFSLPLCFLTTVCSDMCAVGPFCLELIIRRIPIVYKTEYLYKMLIKLNFLTFLVFCWKQCRPLFYFRVVFTICDVYECYGPLIF